MNDLKHWLPIAVSLFTLVGALITGLEFALKTRSRRSKTRIARLKAGIYQFGHDGMHRGNGSAACPRYLHHHHDELCPMPTTLELIRAGINPRKFKAQSRR